jgi:hypothetical protein
MKTWTIKLIVGGCFILALVVTVTSFFCNDDFWKVNAAQALTLILTICIAFWATQLKNDVRKKKEHAEQILKKIQAIVNNDGFYYVSAESDAIETKKRMTMTFRSLNNSIDLLKKYGQELGFKVDAEYIEKEFKDYRDFVSEHITDVDYLSRSESTLRKHSENIDNKCDIIIWGLY